MRRLCTVVAVLSLAGGAAASWYWPFGSSDDGSEPVRRLSELMEPASRLIDEASDLAADGKTQESVEKYREALGELDRIEEENPDRAASAEFATLRNKRAYVNAAIDSLLLGQVRENAKAVAVSDTTELEKRLAAEKAKARGEKAAVKMLVEGYKKEQGVPDVPKIVYIGHTSLYEKVKTVKKMVEEVVEPGTIVECINLGPVIGSHIGPSFYSICGWGFHRREEN